jgi:hypothetical protein
LSIVGAWTLADTLWSDVKAFEVPKELADSHHLLAAADLLEVAFAELVIELLDVEAVQSV